MPINKTLFVWFAVWSQLAGAETVLCRFTDLRSGKGELAISVFSESEREAYPSNADKAIRKFYIKLEGRTQLDITVSELPPGRYAIAAMHDEDGDKKMKTGLFGIPSEGFGFSKKCGLCGG